MTERQMIVVWFSCGAASACALWMTCQKYRGEYEVRAVNQPIAEEHEDNRRFLADVSTWCDIEIEESRSIKFPKQSAVEVWDNAQAIAFPHGAPCTTQLKRKPRQEWEKINNPDWHVLGFTYEERHRHEKFVLTERENLIPVLIDAGMTKADCFDLLRRHKIALPHTYILGFPNGNCIGCGKGTSPTYWNHVRLHFPEVFEARAVQSRRLGVRLVRWQGQRIFLDELPPDAVGRPMKSMPECGLFCEEWKP